ncbi:MAG: excinuclease ABC subunit UvrA [Flavobacteriales bacterium]|nr:excinuclease ABC subunit UvrA [Flavobacteriales bacterium]
MDSKKNTYIEVLGAREHNLKNIDVKIPRNKLVVITGLSGSGKSSLAFDTIYAEGQRRYIESFSAYARQFLGGMERPDVDKINGLSPVISIEQKTTNKNPRSTVGTITEIYDFLRLLFARASEAYSYNTGEKMARYTDDQILEILQKEYVGKEIYLLAPVVKGRKGHYRELFEKIRKQGFLKVRVDGEITEISFGMKLDRYKIHDIEILIDTLKVEEGQMARLKRSLMEALKYGKGSLIVAESDSKKKSPGRHLSRFLMCPTTGIAYDEPAPNLFSFNSPYGACVRCNGLGEVLEIDLNKIIPNSEVSIKKGGIAPLGPYKDNWIFRQIEAIGKVYGFNLNTPVGEIDDEALNVLLYGSSELIRIKETKGSTNSFAFEGIASFISNQLIYESSKAIKKWAHSFMQHKQCPECNGTRLKKESLYFRIDGKNIAELSQLDIRELQQFFASLEERLSPTQQKIAAEVLKEIRKRIRFLTDVGLEYLSLNRPTRSLSGGEAQRIRLATQIGSQLVGVLYILDEPSIGLHQRDNQKLIRALKSLRDVGNSVIVVEHDKDMMLESDYILDIGPGAGIHGGRVVASGPPDEFILQNSETAKFLSDEKNIPIPSQRRKGNGKTLTLHGASGHNLKNVTLKLPLGTFVCITGVSGSGKSSLINDTLYPALNRVLYKMSEMQPLPFKKLTGEEHIDKVIRIDQSPIGRTPRSNPATYTGVFSDIRTLFAELPEAKIRGYKPGRFSFNVKGGRCETCGGAGVKIIEMNFLPDVEVVCETCNGKRYNRETLEIRYKGKSISDVLDMTIDDAVSFFENIPHITRKIDVLKQIGLGYITLGQSSTTLSGGEAQRVKLASELNRTDTGNTLYILDEPTTGLHFEDIRVLLDVLNRLVDKGNTVVVIEHNMDVIKSADWIIDLGPEGGREGGMITFEGTPEEMITLADNYTATYLMKEFESIHYK